VKFRIFVTIVGTPGEPVPPADWQSQGCPVLLGHTKIESTVRYHGIEVDDALAVTEQVDV
jgi:hypothetical protein